MWPWCDNGKHADCEMEVQEAKTLKQYSNKQKLLLIWKTGCTVIHGVTAHSMSSDNHLVRYNRIVFKFFSFRQHQVLVRGFFESARKMLKDEDGDIHLTHKTANPFIEREIETLAKEKGLCLIMLTVFDQLAYPGYSNKKGTGTGCDSNFPIRNAVTFMFKK
ncbi:hypothetical protein N665_0174s0019 [Sinapis alba]|nr:hypothetical protein N665_0174s0019 [Sinapis alba]